MSDRSNPRDITRRPADYILQLVCDDISWIAEHHFNLVYHSRIQMAVVRVSFCCNFLQFGRAMIKYSVAALASALLLK